ncbi:helix-turn-helix domain-containing protein [Alkaliphilus metalliredigens]|uniref:PucR family transcriptional regulator n=1 Tax=Alkaliphilus metalliredigens TaxID=208226 RepID=UPI0012EE199A
MNLTAEKLFIHRNTMGYRIQEIEDILGMDLKDGENTFQLNYSIRILYMLN